jgi:RNA polymerase sigma factor (sigma-70 family)
MGLSNDDKRRFVESHRAGQMSHCVEILHRSLDTDAFRFFRRKVGSEDAARELVQQIWLVVAKEIERLNHPMRVEGWFWRIARSLRSGHHRGTSRDRRLSERVQQEVAPVTAEEPPADEEPLFFGSVAKEQIEQAIDSLPFESQVIVRNKYFKGKRYKEIAEFLDCSPERVRKIAQRARDTIRSLVGVADAQPE